ncbi:MAG: PAS domain S-box protein [Candidatus Aquicultor sp.]|nr:PAS domain S-box protein [Candidatus Aquicultor sp.]
MDNNDRKEGLPDFKNDKALLRAIIDSAPEGIVVADSKGNVVMTNKAADELYTHPVSGQRRSEGITDFKVVDSSGEPYSPEDLPLKRSALKGEASANIEFTLVWPNDKRRELLMNTAPIRDADGVILGAVGVFQDITLRKQSADDVRESRQQVIDILNSISDAFFALDNSWRFTYLNKKAEKLLRKKKENLLFRNIWDEFPEGVDSTFSKEYERAKLENVPVSFEEYYPPLEIWLKVDAYPYKNGLSVFFSDITEQRRIAQELRENQQLLQGIIDNASSVIFVKDAQGRFVLVNHQFEKIFDISKEELIGKTDFELFEHAVAEEFTAHDREIFENGRLLEFEETAPQKDGVHTYITIKFPLRDVNGDIYALCGIATDITNRKQAEEALRESENRFRATFELAAVGIAHVDLDGRFIRLNETYCNIVGYPRVELTRLSFQDITHPDDLEDDLRQARELLEGAINTYSMEKRYIKKDGSIVWVSLSASLVRSENGEPRYYIAVVEDISERKPTEKSTD